ncbi:hypothetical protein EOPP23_10100 [Endozoicomonas sp. OPT23]|uniref:hypothetical protein n=1 Tax=Endozoicomonas sp. OPT23 TaxID=2072845 RepID=UPI00129C0FB4|nr:hypothetical protein [Endozoicomonas sp. OPT23]MRI33335.1 hypothetical protein [Endozoicomonas sp. OPT23]
MAVFVLVLVNLFFALGVGAFLVIPVTSNWAWLGLLFSWCVAEGWLSKSASLKWWHFTLLFIVLGAGELWLLQYTANWR